MNVVNKDYQKLEKEIQALSGKWSQKLEDKTLIRAEETAALQQYPILPQLQLAVDYNEYKGFIQELATLLESLQPALQPELTKLVDGLTDAVLEQWMKEAIVVNNFYFDKFAQEKQLPDWLPMFMAEHAVRPFLQKAAAELKDGLKKENIYGGCPCCGEPPRVATFSKIGKKLMTCPRCLSTWEIKRISCAHCGNDDHKEIEIIKIEKDDSKEIHACKKCKGYTKVLDTRKLIRQQPIQLLDSQSIHLDFIAQENGYGVPEKGQAH